MKVNIVTKDQYMVFSDLAKLLFGAFIGSFASERIGKRDEDSSQRGHDSASNRPVKMDRA